MAVGASYSWRRCQRFGVVVRRRGVGPDGVIEAEIALFVATEYRRVVGAIAVVCGSRAVAEDVVQEALARAWERSARGMTIDSLPAWVTAVALNLARSGLRRRRVEARVHRVEGAHRAAELDSDAIEDRLDLALAVRALPRRQREVVVLRHHLGMDVRSIARALDVSEGTVKTGLHRAHHALAARLESSAVVRRSAP